MNNSMDSIELFKTSELTTENIHSAEIKENQLIPQLEATQIAEKHSETASGEEIQAEAVHTEHAQNLENSHTEIFQFTFDSALEIDEPSEDEMVLPIVTEEPVEDLSAEEVTETSEFNAAEANLEQALPLQAQASELPQILVDDRLLLELKKIPNKMAFKIGDVAQMLGIKQYVLRYWEQEFEILKPKKAQNNQRMYSRKHVENAFLIRKLLYRDKFSIEGARQALKNFKGIVKKEIKKEQEITSVIQKVDSVQDLIKNFITEIRKTKSNFERL